MSAATRDGPAAAADAQRRLGTAPVLLAGVSTILGAIMFLRFGYAVGHLGLLGALAVIVLGHLITVPTALALSEIATNRRVAGGGEYFIVSRSFGLRLGGAIGASLYLSQALSVGFYCIALGEALSPLAPYLHELAGARYDVRMVAMPAVALLGAAVMRGGANTGVAMLYAVVAIVGLSLVSFFMGEPTTAAAAAASDGRPWLQRIPEPDGFFAVFAVCFPGFTGMTAGVGLSGDLARPRRSIPLGTLGATAIGFVVYVAIVVALSTHAAPEELAGDQMVMARIAKVGWLIPIGLACAALSSAIGSILVAPRTVQALTRDRALPLGSLNRLLARGRGEQDEPRAGTALTTAIALLVTALGSVDTIARLISMFFMLTYGALCAISFLEHFAGNPSYRPSFRSRWYISLFGAVGCGLLMFQMDPLAASAALLCMWGLYNVAQPSPRGEAREGMGAMLRAAMGQAARRLTLRVQQADRSAPGRYFRPSVIAVSDDPPDAHGELTLLHWLCEQQGFGTYVRRLPGYLDAGTWEQSQRVQRELIRDTRERFAGVHAYAIVSPSRRSALAQALQLPGVSGQPNNTALFALDPDADDARFEATVDDSRLALATGRNVLVLRSDGAELSPQTSLHVWLTWNDTATAPLLILLAHILLGAPPFRRADLRIFVALPRDDVPDGRQRLQSMLDDGRIPLPRNGLQVLPVDDEEAFRALVAERSGDAGLVLMACAPGRADGDGGARLRKHGALRRLLFVTAAERVRLD